MKNRQAELVKQLTSQQLKQQTWISQGLIAIIALIASWILFDDWSAFTSLFVWSLPSILLFGIGSALIIVLLDLLMMWLVPKTWWNDGGINEKLFREGSYLEIILLCMVVAFVEEWLFRGVIQTQFGLFVASVLFALIHIRYLTKVALFTGVLILSFWLGFVYWWTDSLLVVIVLHFVVNVIQACIIRSGRVAIQ
ncbi:CPBP family intramembrane glutamic endopeptidase [Gracilibacillus timonensis]|uniref:CPBP family intramembrane glutamic endopeptidase n=1 Tax=Gracilibacillus timonensis TaxID=1816696 RepID=UPI000825EB8B|nr:CPBP family intramembrane glutamic endopeptidase [Gracilibacillus timonensis]